MKTIGGTVVYVRDVAHVRDGYAPQTNIVRVDGKRAALLTVEKTGSASTLTIIDQEGDAAEDRGRAAEGAAHSPLDDQSVFVKAAVQGVVREALIAACLTALMILLFLGSWRATLIIAITIPLAVLTSLLALAVLGQTINIMTLGGLALAVGIRWTTQPSPSRTSRIISSRRAARGGHSDRRGRDRGADLRVDAVDLHRVRADVPAHRRRALPVRAAGRSGDLRDDRVVLLLAHAGADARDGADAREGHGRPPRVFARLARFQAAFEHRFEAVRLRYRALLAAAIARRRRFAAAFLLACVASTGLFAFAGGLLSVGRYRRDPPAPARADRHADRETARLTDEVEAKIRGVIPADQLAGVLDNIGVPVSGINLTYDASDPIGTGDADVLITLKPNHASTAAYVATLRNVLAQSFPGVTFAFLPADIVSQILNFGLPAPIDIQIVGNKLDQNRAVANALLAKLRGVRGRRRAHPATRRRTGDRRERRPHEGDPRAAAARRRAEPADRAVRQLADHAELLARSAQRRQLSGARADAAVHGEFAAGARERAAALRHRPRAADAGRRPGGRRTRAEPARHARQLSRTTQQAVVSHYNVQPVLDLFASVQGATSAASPPT